MLIDVAAASGLDADIVDKLLAEGADADAVRREIAEAQAIGVTGVPFFIFAGRVGVPGAQDVPLLRRAMAQARAAMNEEPATCPRPAAPGFGHAAVGRPGSPRAPTPTSRIGAKSLTWRMLNQRFRLKGLHYEE